MKFTGGVKTLLPLRTGSQPAGSHGSRIRQIVYAMNLAALIVLTACLQVSARGFSQERVSLVEKDAPLKEVLKEIGRQTGYRYFFVDQWEAQAKKITVDVKNVSLEAVLDLCFKDQPFTYSIVDRTIVVQQKGVEKKATSATSPPSDIKGRVTNDKGEPLVGASIEIRGSKKGALTDANGVFELRQVDPDARVIISYTGYVSQEISVRRGAFLPVSLVQSINSLDETVVIAYGTTTKRLSTGDVSTVKAADIEKQPVANPLLALEGRVPGMFITQSSGLPGSGVTVRVQGQNSISNGNDPLYVIDGVPYTSQLLPGISGILGGSGGIVSGGVGTISGNPLSFINPADIESIDVLKDADATAIYGSRAANGAILITTKKGKAGQTKVDINLQDGWGQVARKLGLMNTPEYLQMRHEALKNDGIVSPAATDYDINGAWDATRYTDWQKKLIGGTAQYMNANAGISGGSALTQYLVGGSYHRETTVFPGDLSDQKGSLHFNINNISADRKFHLQLSGSYMVDNNRLLGTDLTNTAIKLAPNAPAIYNTDGSLNWAPIASGVSTWTNPLSYLYNKYSNKTNNLISNAVLSYRVLPGLDIRTSLGYTNLQSNETIINPLVAVLPESRPATNRTAVYGSNSINSWIVEPQASYERSIGRGKLQMLAGTTVQQNNSNGQQLRGTGYNSDLVLEDIKSAAAVTVVSTIASVYKYNALFGRLNYNWMDKYLIDLSARRDGSSRFGAANQFHNFGAAGAAWIFTREDFFNKSLPFVSFGKLRASYGTTGNDQIGDYRFLNLYNPTSVATPYQGTIGLLPNGLTNPYLQWEETRKWQFGMDLGLWKDRILFNVNYFYNRSSNELINYALPYLAGFTSVTRNFPATVQNSGWEYSLNTVNIKTRDFDWTSRINLTLPQNKLVAFPNLSTSTYASNLVVGEPITIVKLFHFLGVDPATGVYQFADSHGTPTSSPNAITDKTVLVNTAPKFYGGFDNSFRYKGFELDMLFQFVKQVGLNYFFGSEPGYYYSTTNVGNQPLTVLPHWQKPGDITSIQRYSTYSSSSLVNAFNNASNSSDAAYSDASYIRLKNLSLSWQLPDGWIRKVRLQNARLYLQGQNLLTITRYMGMDPENRSTASLPPLRVLTFGLQVGL
jgi:TonB-linked SusC/RagA family outer membrane protein